jgi:hypothetical protein
VLTKADDYPIHQTAEPIAYSGTDRNFYDRYFFNGYGPDGESFFAGAMGIYPHLNVIDASFSVIHEGKQRNVHASRCLNMERMDTHVGPISVEVVEPLRRLRLRVDDRKHGVRADLLFTGRARVLEEPRFTHRIGPRTFMDLTRMTQNGAYEGWIEVEGKRIEVSPDRFRGTRDRSWGVRNVGAPDAQPLAPTVLPQFYWLWAPLNFDDCVTLFDVNTDAKGVVWHANGVVAPLGDVEPERMAAADASVAWRSGTRHAARATILFRRHDGGDIQIVLEPEFQFFMAGLGYFNPEWGHGLWKGDDAAGYDAYDLSKVNETDPLFLHVQAFCRARMRDGDHERRGIGVLEQLVIGPHEPSGFKSFLDGAP